MQGLGDFVTEEKERDSQAPAGFCTPETIREWLLELDSVIESDMGEATELIDLMGQCLRGTPHHHSFHALESSMEIFDITQAKKHLDTLLEAFPPSTDDTSSME